jgi:predicted MFS family arabinose efflux permease
VSAVSSGGPLWTQPDFVRLWMSLSVAQVGSAVTRLAIPTLIILRLHASPLQVGIVSALELVPFPVLGVFLGILADRAPRRLLMVAADVGRALALAWIPLADLAHRLSLEQVYLVALSTGVLTVIHDVSSNAFLPSLVARSRLLDGNAKLAATESLAQTGGPSVGGALVQAVGPALAVGVNAMTFLACAAGLASLRQAEGRSHPSEDGEMRELWRQLAAGVLLLVREPTLARLTGCAATGNLGYAISYSMLFLFAYRSLGLTPGQMGLILAAHGMAAFAGAVSSSRIAASLGTGPTVVLAAALQGAGWLLVPLAALGAAPVVLVVAGAVFSWSGPVYNVLQISLRQALTPPRLLGRLTAAMRAVIWGSLPLGFAAGGALGVSIGPVATILVGAALSLLAVAWLLDRRTLGLRPLSEMLPADLV